jgi:uncharacterized protein (TIGR03435 family)
MAVDVNGSGAAFQMSTLQQLFTAPPNTGWDVTADGEPFLMTVCGVIEPKAGRPIVDETGLTGRYDFKIHFEWIRRTADAGVASESAPSIFTAVEEQLGLKLESDQIFPSAHH